MVIMVMVIIIALVVSLVINLVMDVISSSLVVNSYLDYHEPLVSFISFMVVSSSLVSSFMVIMMDLNQLNHVKHQYYL